MALDKVLIVDDDKNICDLLRLYLEKEGYGVILSHDGDEAVAKFNALKPDLILLDIMLPGMDGWQICREIRKKSNVPIIMITAKGETIDKVIGLELGADDYIVKPFRIRELLARVRRILSANIKNGEKDNIIYIGHAAIHTDEAKVYVNDKSIELTALEYRLLLIFASNKGILLKRQQILDKIWDADGNFVEDNTLTVYVKRLREKLGEAIHIETVRGMGYRVD